MSPGPTSFDTWCVAIAALAIAAGSASADDAPMRDYADESRQVFRFCRNFTQETRSELASVQYSLSRDELTDLLALRNEASAMRWLDEYWRGRDPNFATTENEARVEHDRRVEIATSWFGCEEWPGWDQRGEICIRYGLPQGRDVAGAEVKAPGTYIRPMEWWAYSQLGMTVQFEDAFGNGEYTYFLEHVQLPSEERARNDRRTMASEFMPDRDLETMTLDASIGMDLPNASWEFMFDDYQQSLFNFPEVLATTPVVYPYDFADRRVPFDFDAALFRGGDAVDRVDVNTEFSVEHIEVMPGAEAPRQYRATAVFFDQEANEVARSTHAVDVRNVSAEKDSVFSMIMQLPFTLSPASYQLAITLEEVGTGRFTSLRTPVICDDFDRSLALSTVCFSSRIEPTTRNSAFNRGALEVVPKPSARYYFTTSVPVYFEVYNLTPDRDGAHRYTVSYRVLPLSPAPKSLWRKIVGGADDAAALASSFESAATGPHDVVYLFLKTDQLWPGDFEFDVTVVDEVSRHKTSRKGRFSLIE